MTSSCYIFMWSVILLINIFTSSDGWNTVGAAIAAFFIGTHLPSTDVKREIAEEIRQSIKDEEKVREEGGHA